MMLNWQYGQQTFFEGRIENFIIHHAAPIPHFPCQLHDFTVGIIGRHPIDGKLELHVAFLVFFSHHCLYLVDIFLA